MNKNSIILEQKRAELQVKLTILQENINNLKNELSNDEEQNYNINNIYPGQSPQISNLITLSNEYNSANELFKLKQLEKNSLEAELTQEKKDLEKIKLVCTDLIQQRTSLEQENLYYKKKAKELEDNMDMQKKRLFELKNRKELLKQEVEILKGENISNTKFQYDNEKIEQNTNTQREYIDEQLSTNAKRIQLLQIKIDNLNKDIFELENEIKKILKENDDMNSYNMDIENKIITMGENSKAYNEKINLLQREIDETKDYIGNSQKEKKSLQKKLDQLTDILEKINQANVKINANLNIVKKSLEKKAEFMKKEEDYYSNCEKVKQKMVEVCKEIDSYSDLI
jgi:chromosome segregation ATPase